MESKYEVARRFTLKDGITSQPVPLEKLKGTRINIKRQTLADLRYEILKNPNRKLGS